MIIKVREAQGVPVLILSGRLDVFAKNAFKEAIESQKESNAKRVLIDMRGVSFVDSEGLGIMALAVKAFRELKGTLIVVNPQEQVKSILQNMNFNKILPMFQTNDDYTTFSEIS